MRTVALYEMLFGVITVVGGIIGIAAADSWISLVTGLVAGIVLFAGALKMQKSSRAGLYICLIITAALLTFFGMRYFSAGGTIYPDMVMSILGLISLLLLMLLLVQPAERKRIF
jgi:uncharacterized membrane protein (UPF0136 family)